jgi:RNA polymerase sigma-70 factor (ECF subfamily)
MKLSDYELFLQLVKGDENSLAELILRFQNKVYNTALSYLQNNEEAEEVAMDVFLELFQSAANFRGESSVSTWIYRITINKSLDKLKYRNRKKRLVWISSIFSNEEGELLHDKPHFAPPGILLENKEKSVLLFKAIDQLPEKQKSAYLLSYVEMLPQNEVAQILETSVGAVESLLQRAKVKLRKELEKYYPERVK